jgi:hypothetical protein
MILIVFMALASALVIQSIRVARRDRELSTLVRLLDEYRRVTDRLEWAERMHQKGYVSKSLVDSERTGLNRALFALSQASPSPSSGGGQ